MASFDGSPLASSPIRRARAYSNDQDVGLHACGRHKGRLKQIVGSCINYIQHHNFFGQISRDFALRERTNLNFYFGVRRGQTFLQVKRSGEDAAQEYTNAALPRDVTDQIQQSLDSANRLWDRHHNHCQEADRADALRPGKGARRRHVSRVDISRPVRGESDSGNSAGSRRGESDSGNSAGSRGYDSDSSDPSDAAGHRRRQPRVSGSDSDAVRSRVRVQRHGRDDQPEMPRPFLPQPYPNGPANGLLPNPSLNRFSPADHHSGGVLPGVTPVVISDDSSDELNTDGSSGTPPKPFGPHPSSLRRLQGVRSHANVTRRLHEQLQAEIDRLNARLKELTEAQAQVDPRQIAELERQKAAALAQMVELRKRALSLNEQRIHLQESEIPAARERLRATEQQLAALKQRLAELAQEMHATAGGCEDVGNKIAALKAERLTLIKQQAALLRGKGLLLASIDELNADKLLREGDLRGLQEALERIRAAHELLTAERETLVEDLEAAQRELAQGHEQRAQLAELIANLKRDNGVFQQRHEELQMTGARIKRNCQDTHLQNKELAAQLAALEAERARLLGAKQEAQSNLPLAQQLVDVNAAAAAKQKQDADRIVQLTAANEQLTADQARYEALLQELEALRAEAGAVPELRREIAVLRGEINQGKVIIQQLRDGNQRIQLEAQGDLKDRLAAQAQLHDTALRATQARHEEELAAERQRLTTLEATIPPLRQLIAEQRGQLQTAAEGAQALQAQIDALTKERDALKVSSEQTAAQQRALDQHISELTGALKTAEGAAQALRTQLDTEQSAATKTIDQLRADLATAKRAHAEQLGQITALAKERDALQAAGGQTTAAQKVLDQRIAELTAAAQKLQGQLSAQERREAQATDQLRKQISAQGELLKAAEESARGLQGQIAPLTQERDALRAAGGQSTAAQKVLDQRIAALKNQLEQATAAAGKLRDENNHLDRDLKALKAPLTRLFPELGQNPSSEQLAAKMAALAENARAAQAEVTRLTALLKPLETQLAERTAQLAKAQHENGLIKQRTAEEIDALRRQFAADKAKLDAEILQLKAEIDRLRQLLAAADKQAAGAKEIAAQAQKARDALMAAEVARLAAAARIPTPPPPAAPLAAAVAPMQPQPQPDLNPIKQGEMAALLKPNQAPAVQAELLKLLKAPGSSIDEIFHLALYLANHAPDALRGADELPTMLSARLIAHVGEAISRQKPKSAFQLLLGDRKLSALLHALAAQAGKMNGKFGQPLMSMLELASLVNLVNELRNDPQALLEHFSGNSVRTPMEALFLRYVESLLEGVRNAPPLMISGRAVSLIEQLRNHPECDASVAGARGQSGKGEGPFEQRQKIILDTIYEAITGAHQLRMMRYADRAQGDIASPPDIVPYQDHPLLLEISSKAKTLQADEKQRYATAVKKELAKIITSVSGYETCTSAALDAMIAHAQRTGQLPPAIWKALSALGGKEALVVAELLYTLYALEHSAKRGFEQFASHLEWAWLTRNNVEPAEGARRLLMLVATFNKWPAFRDSVMTSGQVRWAQSIAALFTSEARTHIFAEAGSGKTTIAMFMVDYLKTTLPHLARKQVHYVCPYAMNLEHMHSHQLTDPRGVEINVGASSANDHVVLIDEAHLLDPSAVVQIRSNSGTKRVSPLLITATPVIPLDGYAAHRQKAIRPKYTERYNEMVKQRAALSAKIDQLEHHYNPVNRLKGYTARTTGPQFIARFQGYLPKPQQAYLVNYVIDHQLGHSPTKTFGAFSALDNVRGEITAANKAKLKGPLRKLGTKIDEMLLSPLLQNPTRDSQAAKDRAELLKLKANIDEALLYLNGQPLDLGQNPELLAFKGELAELDKAIAALQGKVQKWQREAAQPLGTNEAEYRAFEQRVQAAFKGLNFVHAGVPPSKDVATHVADVVKSRPTNATTIQLIFPGLRFGTQMLTPFLTELAAKMKDGKPMRFVYQDSHSNNPALRGKRWVVEVTADGSLGDPIPLEECGRLGTGRTILLYDCTNKQGGDFGEVSRTGTGASPDIAQYLFYNVGEVGPTSAHDFYQALSRRRGPSAIAPVVVCKEHADTFMAAAHKHQIAIEREWAINNTARRIARKLVKAHTLLQPRAARAQEDALEQSARTLFLAGKRLSQATGAQDPLAQVVKGTLAVHPEQVQKAQGAHAWRVLKLLEEAAYFDDYIGNYGKKAVAAAPPAQPAPARPAVLSSPAQSAPNGSAGASLIAALGAPLH